eukprot:3991029-Pyramimonas_sp.AAC.1
MPPSGPGGQIDNQVGLAALAGVDGGNGELPTCQVLLSEVPQPGKGQGDASELGAALHKDTRVVAGVGGTVGGG